jgi:hypothetical protein
MAPRPSAATVIAAGQEMGGLGITKRRHPWPSAACGGSVNWDQVPGRHRGFILHLPSQVPKLRGPGGQDIACWGVNEMAVFFCG